MPLYEYQCESCQHRFERIQKFSDAPVSECPKCGGPVRKLLSSPAIQFKGTGWYITDYARQGEKTDKTGKGGDKPAAAESSSGEATASAKEAGKESAPAKTDSESKSKPAADAKPAKAT